jgi:hypothetical protein
MKKQLLFLFLLVMAGSNVIAQTLQLNRTGGDVRIGSIVYPDGSTPTSATSTVFMVGGGSRFLGNSLFAGYPSPVNGIYTSSNTIYAPSMGSYQPYLGGIVRIHDVSGSYPEYFSSMFLSGNELQTWRSYRNGSIFITGTKDFKINRMGGNVGISTGNNVPVAKLHVGGIDAYALRLDGIEPFQTMNHTDGKEYAYLRAWTTNPGNSASYYGLELGVPPADANGPAKHLMFATNYALRMVILDNGNVGIGTTNPTYKLAVNGTIRAKDVRIETGWSDFVFEKNYRLRPLHEVEKFIQTYHHLPDIAPASEIQEQGLGLSEATTKLMQKVEELTLYIIDLQRSTNQRIGDLEKKANGKASTNN